MGAQEPCAGADGARYGVQPGARQAPGLLAAFCELLWPARCVGCEMPGTLLCGKCEAELPLIDQADACPYCGAPHGALVCTECSMQRQPGGFPFAAARAAGTFEGALARMVLLYKDSGEQRLAAVLARLMAQAAGEEWRSWAEAAVFVPASPEAYRRRGFDHMELVARHLSRLCNVPMADALVRLSASDQRQLGREQRFENVSGTFRMLGGPMRSRLAGAHVLLVDDVFTTGATLCAASDVLLAAGVGEVRVLVAARVW